MVEFGPSMKPLNRKSLVNSINVDTKNATVNNASTLLPIIVNYRVITLFSPW